LIAMRGRALITGATAGIGNAFARELAGRGHDLVIVARDTQRLETVAAGLRDKHHVEVDVITADLTTDEGLRATVNALTDSARPVDLLVNNAGFGLKGRFLDNPLAQEQEMLDVLVTAVMRLSHAALAPMAERGSGGVINVSSVAAFLPRGTYAAAKAWVNSFSEWAANEYRSRGVTVMALCPGFTKTEFHERMGVRRGTSFLWMEPEALVARALSDFDKGRTFSIPGAQYKVIVALTKLIPSRALQGYQSMGRK
jgi:uncharacterized protein